MASIVSDPNGHKRILFIAGNRKRRAVRLGRASIKQAEAFKVRVQQLVSALVVGQPPDDETNRWLTTLDDVMHSRLSAVGLTKARGGDRAVLSAFIDAWIGRRTDIKPHTLLNMKQLQRWMLAYFGENRDIRTITAADAEDFRLHMAKGGLGENTIRRHIGRARQLFKSAIRRGLLRGSNPFDGMAATVRADKTRMFFVSREMVAKVIDACPDAEWRLLVAFSRFGGLRCPSEHLALKWRDVDWDKARIRVPSPKTEHHEGKDCRYIPLFPELRPHLLEMFDAAEAGAEYVITRYRQKNCNLRTQFERIIRKAGLEPWPKPWHNLRSTRQTELAEQYPIHVVCAWIGNSRAVAQEHYLQVTDAHFEHAAKDPIELAAQNAAQQSAEKACEQSQAVGVGAQKGPEFPADSTGCDFTQFGNYPRQDSNL